MLYKIELITHRKEEGTCATTFVLLADTDAIFICKEVNHRGIVNTSVQKERLECARAYVRVREAMQ